MSDAVEMDPKVIQVKRLHKKTSKDDLRALAEQFGAITNISLWYGFGTGLIEMQDAQVSRVSCIKARQPSIIGLCKVSRVPFIKARQPSIICTGLCKV
jgi:hypothetical protein